MIIKKKHIAQVLSFTLNIGEDKINHHILNATKYDLKPYIGNELITALGLVCVASEDWDGDWAEAVSYEEDDIVIHGEGVWLCLNDNTDSEPDAGNTDWELMELETLWYFNFRVYLANNSIARYCVRAGKNFTQFGITKPLEPSGTAAPVDPKELAAMIKDFENDASKEFSLLTVALGAYESGNKWTIGGEDYSKPDGQVSIKKTKSSFGIGAID